MPPTYVVHDNQGALVEGRKLRCPRGVAKVATGQKLRGQKAPFAAIYLRVHYGTLFRAFSRTAHDAHSQQYDENP